MALDPRKNFAKATVQGGYSAGAVLISVAVGQAAGLPAAPFNAVWYNSTDYADPSDDPNKEVIRITDKTGDDLTITRAQEGTTATAKNLGGRTYKLLAGATAKTITDIETDIASKINSSEKGAANGVATLGSDSKIPAGQLPNLTITDTFVINSQAAMLALTAQTGDVAIRTDQSKTYILKGSNASVLGDWQELQTPTGGGMTIGQAVSGATNNRFLFVDASGNLGNSDKLEWDGNDIKIKNPTAATVGVQDQPSPYLYLIGNKWDTNLGSNGVASLRIRNKPEQGSTNQPSPSLTIDASASNVNGWLEIFSIKINPSNYLNTQMKIGNPIYGSWGGIMEVTYEGNFEFKTVGGALGGLRPGYITWNGSISYQNIQQTDSGYGTQIQTMFGTPFAIKNIYGGNLNIRIKSDDSNYLGLTVESTLATLGPNGTLDSWKFATGLKLGFFGATPAAQPTTGGAAAAFTANSGTAVNDASTFDGYTIKQAIKALRTLGLLA
jgi:hypothetical protein